MHGLHKASSRWLLAGLVLVLGACASMGSQMDALEKAQYAYSAAIRWGDIEGAWTLVDPEYREAHPMTDLEFERFKQVQVTGYRDLASQVGDDVAAREIEIGVANRHTMTSRSIRYTERWRYDAASKTWWLTTGLPDFWAGQ